MQELRALCPYLTPEQLDKFELYYRLMSEKNEVMNLTSISGRDGYAEKHFADSLLPLALIPQGARVVDVGTGGGLPGVPLAIARPDIRVTLMDATGRKIDFLREVVAALNLNAEPLWARAEEAGRRQELRGRFDIAVTRGVANVPQLLELTVPLLKVGGTSLMYKGAAAHDELAAAKSALTALSCSGKITEYAVSWGERSVIAAKKRSATSDAFPRPMSTIKKKPL